MAPRKQAFQPSPAAVSPTATKTTTTTAASQPLKSQNKQSTPSSAKNAQDIQQIALGVWNRYVDKTPQRVKLLDAFLAFLIVVGVLQFVYCCIVGNYPFNAFLSGFGATIGQFVLTASLRIQTDPENKSDFGDLSDERAFADFVFASIILHFFCINFIN